MTQSCSHHVVDVSLLTAEVVHQSLKAMLLLTHLKDAAVQKLIYESMGMIYKNVFFFFFLTQLRYYYVTVWILY